MEVCESFDELSCQRMRQRSPIKLKMLTAAVENNFVYPTSEGDGLLPSVSPSLTLKSVGLVVVCGLMMILPMSNDDRITPCTVAHLKK